MNTSTQDDTLDRSGLNSKQDISEHSVESLMLKFNDEEFLCL